MGTRIAGLTAAYTLQKRGFDVEVIEASSHVSGRMTTDVIDSHVIDCGASVGQIFFATGETLYTRFGEWFGWTMVAVLIGLIAISILKKQQE
jgi:protoporphyrinogen oxidase